LHPERFDFTDRIMAQEREAFSPILKRYAIPSDSVLIVHSAIAMLSRRGFTAEGLIETFLEHCGQGNVFMPTMTWRTVTPANPDWDELTTASHTGVLTEVFRKRFASARSIHPTHSVAGYGPQAASILARHHIDRTPVGANSPYGLMRDFDAYVLMIGVGLECCTAIHLPEETINPDLYVLPDEAAELYRCRDRHGAVHQVWTRRHRRLDRDFPRFAPALIAKGLMESGLVADCPYSVCSLSVLLREVFAALIDDPRGTLRH
jgi:aminoglycoside 3-N-acetyltransferase